MPTENLVQESRIKAFEVYCKEKGYQISVTPDPTKVRIDISNLSDRTIVNVFNTGTIQVQGKKNPLYIEFSEYKVNLEANPQCISPGTKVCNATYDILLPNIREAIQQSWHSISKNFEITVAPTQHVVYRAKLSDGKSFVTVTQFSNGKVLLQGKLDVFFDQCCNHLEIVAKPCDKDIVSRFISSDQSHLDSFVARYTPDMLNNAEVEVRNNISPGFNFLDSHDQKWLIASTCLCNSGVMLPEYSPFVMPASKAFEGFLKKLLVSIGMVPIDHFSTKTGNFAIMNDKKNPTHIAV